MTGRRWLDAEEQRAWRSFIEAGALLQDALDRQLRRDAGIPHSYYEVLVRLSEAPGRALRMSALASLSASSRSRVSHAVSRLEERGWVTRRPCDEDRRGQVAALTDSGLAALQAAAPGHVAEVRRVLFDRLQPGQVRALAEIAGAVRDHLLDDPSD
jgi:DNA-binding MarR family transcriptional regulator